MRYWKVEAKCGHVKKNKYIVKSFYVIVESGKEAAAKVRWESRVKHHQKNAIKSVSEIDRNSYLSGIKTNNLDPYFKAKNKQEQLARCTGIEYETYYEEKPIVYKKTTHAKQHLIEEVLMNEWEKEKGHQVYE